jgi:hypothetical protein
MKYTPSEEYWCSKNGVLRVSLVPSPQSMMYSGETATIPSVINSMVTFDPLPPIFKLAVHCEKLICANEKRMNVLRNAFMEFRIVQQT